MVKCGMAWELDCVACSVVSVVIVLLRGGIKERESDITIN
jgi:hypothetical protein